MDQAQVLPLQWTLLARSTQAAPAQRQAQNARGEYFYSLRCCGGTTECLSVRIKVHLGQAHPHHPPRSIDIARRKSKCLADMCLSLRAAAAEIFRPADRRVYGGQITIQRQRSLKLGDALNRAIGSSQNGPQHRVSKGVFWSETSGSLVPGLFFQGSVARESLAVAFLGEIAELRREQPLLRGRSVRQKSYSP